jgi:hypothetical protein
MTDVSEKNRLGPIDLGQGLGPLSLGFIGSRVA